MKHFLLLACLILCSCLPQEEAELEYSSPSNMYSDNPCLWDKIPPNLIEYCSTTFLLPCTMPSNEKYEPNISILDYCPAEDVAEFPIQDNLPYNWCRMIPAGGCAPKTILSKEELSFNAQGGISCATTDKSTGLLTASELENSYYFQCTEEEEIEELRDYYSKYWKKLKCPEKDPWLTATIVDADARVLQISVNQNKTKAERKMYIKTDCGGSILITQSAE